MNLKISAWSAIISIIITVPIFILGLILKITPENNQLINNLIIIGILLGILVAFPIFFGYIKIAKLNKLKFLQTMSYLILIGIVIFNIYAIFGINNNYFFTLFLAIILGILEFIAGIALFKLKNVFGNIITAIGTMYIINGLFLISIILLPFVSLPIMITNIMESIFFFKAHEKYK